jgi:probable 2-oxoglutarate dehydrogenase E1 component DHKTD1
MQRNIDFMKRLTVPTLNNFNLITKRDYNFQKHIYTSYFQNKEDLKNFQHLQDLLSHSLAKQSEQPNLARLIRAYRQHGYKIGNIDPLSSKIVKTNSIGRYLELDPESYGLVNYEERYSVDGLLHKKNAKSEKMSLKEIEEYLIKLYAKEMTLEFEHIRSEEEKLWLNKEFELLQQQTVDDASKVDYLKLMLRSQEFDLFLGTKFPTFKRYSKEGGESAMAFYNSLFASSANEGVEDLIMGIAHRGRLNLMICLLNLQPELFFSKIKGKFEYSSEDVPTSVTGDIAHHFPCSTDLDYNGKRLHVSLVQNPSHLEAVDPLVMGKARSKQMIKKEGYYNDTEPSDKNPKVSTFLIHGDAAFAGQGIVSETFQLSSLPNYSVGGTIHLIVNNQVGFTTPSKLARSGNSNSDLTKAYNCPVIHINGDYPQLAHKAAQLCVKYRSLFNKDIVVDMVCFRKHGHNEIDDPTLTNPLMYESIKGRTSVPNSYKEKLIKKGIVTEQELNDDVMEFKKRLETALASVENGDYKIEERNTYLKKQWSDIHTPSSNDTTVWPTGCDLDVLRYVGAGSVQHSLEFVI